MNKHFFSIFTNHYDGSISTNKTLMINNNIYPRGIKIKKGETFLGIDFHKYKKYKVCVDEVYILNGFIKKNIN